MNNLFRFVILAAAWWYQRISFVRSVQFDPVWNLGKRFWPKHAYQVATFLELKLIPFLLADWLVWPIAKDYLQAKWKAEIEEQNRQYYASLGGEK